MNCLGFFEWPFIGNLPIVLRVIAKDRWRMMAYFASDVVSVAYTKKLKHVEAFNLLLIPV